MAEKAKTLLMKVRFYEWLTTRGLTGDDFDIAIILTSFWNPKRGFAWLSQDDLARLTGRQKRSIRRTIARLEEKGIFKVKRPDVAGRGRATEYTPQFDLVPEGNIYDLEKCATVSPFSDSGDGDERGTDARTFDLPQGDEERGTSEHERCAAVSGKVRASAPPSEESSEESYIRSSAEASPCGDAPSLQTKSVGQQLGQIERILKANGGRLNREDLEQRLYALQDELDFENHCHGWAGRLLDELSSLDEEPSEPEKPECEVVDFATARQGVGVDAHQPAELTTDAAHVLITRVIQGYPEAERGAIWASLDFEALDAFIEKLKAAEPENRDELCREFLTNATNETEADRCLT